MTPGKFFEYGMVTILLATIFAAISFGGWAIFQAALASGKIDYCYMQESRGITQVDYQVYGHRPWRQDIIILTTAKLVEAEEWRTKKCPR